MPSGDGLIARVKPPASRLTAAQARLLADAAEARGNGAIELTNRGNLQVRGLSPATAPAFARAMLAAGLASPDAAAERRRTVLLAPVAGADATQVALALEAALAAATHLADLPAKFGFAVDDGALPLTGVRADVRLAPAPDGRWHVASATGALTVPASETPNAALRLAAEASPPPPSGGERVGVRRGSAAARLDTSSPNPLLLKEERAFATTHLPFGATNAAALRALAALAEAHGDGLLRLTPWRAFVMAGAIQAAAIEAAGLIADPADPRLAIAACAGRPACASAYADTRADAARLARLRPGREVHLSGCTKGCAHSGPAAITLVARLDGYALVRNGTAGDNPERTGLTLDHISGLI
jgi:precorrin-3B synthase